MTPPIEERVAALEHSLRQGLDEHEQIGEALTELTKSVARLEVYLANGNGGLTVSVRQKRIRFAGSLSLPWLMGLLGGGSGGGWILGRLLGAW